MTDSCHSGLLRLTPAPFFFAAALVAAFEGFGLDFCVVAAFAALVPAEDFSAANLIQVGA